MTNWSSAGVMTLGKKKTLAAYIFEFIALSTNKTVDFSEVKTFEND